MINTNNVLVGGGGSTGDEVQSDEKQSDEEQSEEGQKDEEQNDEGTIRLLK